MAISHIKERLKNINIPTPAFFIISIFIVMYFVPREGKYRYTYSESKPWQYSLLTAPFNFQIHKPDDLVKAEKDSILQSFQPYYTEDQSVQKKSVSMFEEDSKARSVPAEYTTYLVRKLNEIYKAGIISAEQYEKMQNIDKKQLKLKNEENIYANRHLASFYTPRQAYEKIIDDKPSHLSIPQLQSMNINDYLNPNINYDERTASSIKEELLRGVELYEGMVQSGEKIIDRGEIVTMRTKEILDSYTKEMEKRVGSKINPGWLVLGQLIMISLLIMSLMTYLIYYRPREYKKSKSVMFLLIMVVIYPIITGIMIEYRLDNVSGGFNLLYTVPFAIATILIRTFIDSRTAMTTHLITVLICALMMPQEQIAAFIVIQLLVGFMCIFSLRRLSERSQLIYCGIFILLTYILAYTGWVLCADGDISQINPKMYLSFCINFIFVSFAYLLVYVCERTFGFISEVSMIELSNTNRPLLQQLSEVAPGTFQHSMQISNLVFPAANRIGANASLVRTGALYHDIGKMVNPAFFTENQSPGMNPHVGLTEKESAKIIISHVAEGVRIAKKNGLPQQIIDFIETHHGKGKVKYFYNTYVNNHPDEVVDEADFTYPGPNPFSRETAILMMADGVEAASRSLPEYTKESITELVNRMIDTLVSDGLLKNAPITFRDIEEIKEVFCEKLITIYHTRIAYPKLNKDAEQKTEGESDKQ